MAKFADIKTFTAEPTYAIDSNLRFLPERISEFLDMGLDLNPDFQRGHVWTEGQQTAFVEYVLRGGTSGRIIYFNHPNWQSTRISKKDAFVIVDGKQRLEACLKFMKNELPIFGGNRLRDFRDSIPLMLGLRLAVNSLKTRAEVLQWYIDMNTGGVVHTNEEIDRVCKLLELEQGA